MFVYSNIPMDLIGASHPHKTDALRLLERLVRDRVRLGTDVEALQEILHRYVAIRRADWIQLIDQRAAERAKEIVSSPGKKRRSGLSSRLPA